MTLQTLAHGARRSSPGLMAAAILTAIDADMSLRRHKVHGSAICARVPPKGAIEDKIAVKLLAGSTMNGRYVDEAAAMELLADMKSTRTKRFNSKGANLGNGVAISHHREPRLVAGIVHRRDVRLALDD